MTRLKLVTAPAEEPITLAEAKTHLRVDASDEDALITSLIVAARRAAEQRTGRALVTQTWEASCDEFPGSGEGIPLQLAPVQSVTSVKYIDTAGVEQTIGAPNYTLNDRGSMGHSVLPAHGYAWPSAREQQNAVTVRFVAGYGAAAAVPQDIKAWLLLTIGTLYMQRESFVGNAMFAPAIPDRFWDALLDPYCMVGF